MKNLMLMASLLALAALMAPAPAIAQIDAVTPYADAQNMRRVLEASQRRRGKSSDKTTRPQEKRLRAAILVNGDLLRSEVKPIKKAGRVFVPMRNIFEALGATVSYDSKKRLISAERNGKGMQLALEGAKNDVGSADKPFIRDGVTMVPLRLISEKMGAQVVYTPRGANPLIEIDDKS